MMKNKVNLVLMLSVLIFVFSAMSGCNGTDLQSTSPVSLVIVGSIREGSEPPSNFLSERKIDEMILQAGVAHSRWRFVTVSEDPVISEVHITKESTAVTQEQLEFDQKRNAKKIKEEHSTFTTNAPEADILGALNLAANWLKDEPKENPKLCLVIDSGIGTSGKLSFLQPGLIDSAPLTITEQLANLGVLPDLSGVEVIFAGIGATADPQQAPGETQVEKIRYLWETIVISGGGEIDIVNSRFTSQSVGSKFPVTVVEFPKEADLIFKNPLIFTEQQVRFLGDSDVLVDKVAAIEALKPIAEVLARNPAGKILVAGTTATVGTPEDGIELSELRAETVKRLLINEFDVSEQKLLTVGLGYDRDPFERANDVDTNGNLIELEASKNRRVIILDADDPIAREILRN